MIKRKSTLKYYFSVEGETEQWYLEWLQKQINDNPTADNKVSFNHQIQKNPLKRAKSLAITDKVEIWHLSDYESSDEAHVKQFIENMDEFKHEANFKKCLKQLTIENVIEAVNRAKEIMERNKQNGYTLHQYKGYSYYKENPSIMVWQIVEKILKDCGLIDS